MKKKFISCILSIFLVLIVFLLVGCKNNNFIDKVINVNDIHEQGVRLSVKRNAQSNVESITVNAIISPSNATNKNLNWSLKWGDNDYSESCSDYLNMTISSDTLSCTISYKQSFNKPIILTVYSRSNSNIMATCQIDCYQRSYDSSLNIEYDSDINDQSNSIRVIECNGKEFDFSSLTYEEIMSMNDLVSFTNITSAVKGTIPTVHNYKLSIGWSEEIWYQCNQLGFDSNSFPDLFYELSENKFSFKILLKEITSWEVNSDEIIQVLQNSSHWFYLNIEITDVYNDVIINTYNDFYMLSGFNISDVKLQSILLENTSLIF